MSVVQHEPEIEEEELEAPELQADNDNQPEPEAERTVEDRARLLGWVPLKEFRGDPARWTDAAAFVERGERELPLSRENARRLDRELARSNKEVAALQSTMVEVLDYTRKAEARAYAKAKADLESKRATAVSQADTASFQEADRELAALEKDRPADRPAAAAQPAGQPVIDPYVQEWANANPWFRTDPELADAAQGIHVALQKNRPSMSLEENLTEVRKRVMSAFPEKFGNPRREAPAAVAGSTPQPRRARSEKTFENLPADAKAAYARFAKSMKGFTKEEFVANYDWSA